MRAYFVLILFPLTVFSQDCYLYKNYPRPVMSEIVRKHHQVQLDSAYATYLLDSLNPESIIWLGRRHAYMGDYEKAIEVFSMGIKLFPGDARLYRHRGHRYITLRCLDKAISDLVLASKLIRKKKDEIEPDGQPNDRNIPTSTLHSNIWYHLGLAYYLKGEYHYARKAYEKCLQVSLNPDMYVATANWLYLTFRKSGNEQKAKKLLDTISDSMDIVENKSYHQVLLLYKGHTDVGSFDISMVGEVIPNATTGFAVGNYYLLRGEKQKARSIFERILKGNQWSTFGYLAAETEWKRSIE